MRLDLILLAHVDRHRERALARARWMALASPARGAPACGCRCATSAPARANSIAMDLPMPVPPPVTMAVLPSREKGFLAMARDDTPAGRRRLLRQGDLGLALRDLALDAPPQRPSARSARRCPRRSPAACRAARGPGPRACAAPWPSRRTSSSPVALASTHACSRCAISSDDALHLAVEVGRPLAVRVEARAVGLEHALEVLWRAG